MVLAMAKAIEEGSRAVICASTGNTSASAAAFAARAGLRCIVVIPDGKIGAKGNWPRQLCTERRYLRLKETLTRR